MSKFQLFTNGLILVLVVRVFCVPEDVPLSQQVRSGEGTGREFNGMGYDSLLVNNYLVAPAL